MARKKRRGRPPGSKNKKMGNGKLAGNVANMDVAQLHDYISGLRETLASKIQQQRKFLESQLAGLGAHTGNKARTALRSVAGGQRTGARKKPEPKYQSKKNLRLKWTGRGMTPVWMREEMKGTKLTKDHFLIK